MTGARTYQVFKDGAAVSQVFDHLPSCYKWAVNNYFGESGGDWFFPNDGVEVLDDIQRDGRAGLEGLL